MALSTSYNNFVAGVNKSVPTSNGGATTDNTAKNPLDNTDYVGKTDRGTKIVKKGQDINKDTFLKILSAQMKNQDPTSQSGNNSSDFVGQMAQFASIEQMTNLNTTMTNLVGNSLLGKGVDLNIKDVNGNAMIGIVRVAQMKNGEMTYGVEVNNNGKSEIIEAGKDNILSTYDVPNTGMDNLNVNSALMYASSMIGKNVEIPKEQSSSTGTTGDPNNTTTDVYKGKVTAMFKDKDGIKITVDLGNGEKKDFLYGEVSRIEASS